MTLTLALLLVPGFASGAATGSQANAQAEAETRQLAATWTVVKASREGKEVAPAVLGLAEIRIQGNRFEMVSTKGTAAVSATFRVNPTANPKELDLLNPKKGVLPVIYDLKGDELRLGLPMIDPTGQHKLQRPKSFGAKDPSVVFLTLKRKTQTPRNAKNK